MKINDTGLRGYLKWLQADQPGIYKLIAPHIVQRAPEAFSDYEQSQAMGSLMGLADGTTTTFDTTDLFGNPTATVSGDVASTANSGPASASTTGLISNLVGAVGQIYLAKSQVDLLSKVNDMQLQRAQLGLDPLQTGSLGLGVPQVNVGLSKGTMTGGGVALAVAAVLGGLWIFSGRGGSGRSARR